mmetsp:Transcript_60731/g.142063  ORF Transcript_60731/g.142063 Transcript_60731/m.142063 type:complete len:252 (-) Transcript_60731:320-1075(-)
MCLTLITLPLIEYLHSDTLLIVASNCLPNACGGATPEELGHGVRAGEDFARQIFEWSGLLIYEGHVAGASPTSRYCSRRCCEDLAGTSTSRGMQPGAGSALANFACSRCCSRLCLLNLWNHRGVCFLPFLWHESSLMAPPRISASSSCWRVKPGRTPCTLCTCQTWSQWRRLAPRFRHFARGDADLSRFRDVPTQPTFSAHVLPRSLPWSLPHFTWNTLWNILWNIPCNLRSFTGLPSLPVFGSLPSVKCS